MNKYQLNDAPSWLIVNGLVHKSSVIEISDEALSAGEQGKLIVKIFAQKRSGELKNCKVALGAIRGNIQMIFYYDDSSVRFQKDSSGTYDVRLHRSSYVEIGEKTSSNGVRIVCDDSDFITGNDCLFSDEILIQTADQHGIVDLVSGQLVNSSRRFIKLEEHVWLGRKCTLMPDVIIGKGSIIGTGSVVTKDDPATSIAAGVPAKTLRSDVSWSRSPIHLDNYSQVLVQNYSKES